MVDRLQFRNDARLNNLEAATDALDQTLYDRDSGTSHMLEFQRSIEKLEASVGRMAEVFNLLVAAEVIAAAVWHDGRSRSPRRMPAKRRLRGKQPDPGRDVRQ